MSNIASPSEPALFDWRKYLRAHPAAELFPLMKDTDPAGFENLVSDIRENGLCEPIALFGACDDEHCLIDGRNRLDALASLGLLDFDGERLKWKDRRLCDCWDLVKHTGRSLDPYALVLSFNVHRRHLNAEQKRDVIAKVLKAKPEASNLSIAKQVGADDKVVASVRHELEANSDIPNKTDRVEASGRKARGRRPAKDRTSDKPCSIRDRLRPAFEPFDGGGSVNVGCDIDIKREPAAEPIGTSNKPEAKPEPTDTDSPQDIGAFLERLGTDRFFAALQHAPTIKAEIERRHVHHHKDDLGARGTIITLIGECRAHLHNPKPDNIETVLKKLASIASTCSNGTKPVLDKGAFTKGMGLTDEPAQPQPAPDGAESADEAKAKKKAEEENLYIPGFLKRGHAA
jgi:hypothetical protein